MTSPIHLPVAGTPYEPSGRWRPCDQPDPPRSAGGADDRLQFAIQPASVTVAAAHEAKATRLGHRRREHSATQSRPADSSGPGPCAAAWGMAYP